MYLLKLKQEKGLRMQHRRPTACLAYMKFGGFISSTAETKHSVSVLGM